MEDDRDCVVVDGVGVGELFAGDYVAVLAED